MQPHASQTSQSAVRIHHLDHRRVIIANQNITQSHRFTAQCVMSFFILGTLCPRLPRVASFSSRAHWTVGHYKLGLLQSPHGEANPSSSTRVTKAHLPSSSHRSSPLPSPFRPEVRPTDSPEWMFSSLTSFLHTQPNELCVPYPRLCPVSRRRRDRRHPRVGVLHARPSTIPSVYASASTSRRALHLSLRSSTLCTRLANILHNAKEAR